MGFYSFYRIFKDLIRTFFGTKGFKIFVVVVLFVFLLIALTSMSKASDLRPWNVYTNTTEFNWNRLIELNYTENDSGLSYSYFNISSQQLYYLYNPNSSTGSVRLYSYVSQDDNQLLMLYQDSQHQSSYWFEFSYVFDGGYVDIPYNKPFTPQFNCRIAFDDYVDLELYMLDDKYSNIEAYNEIAQLADAIQGGDIDKSISYSTISGLSVSNGGGNGQFRSGNSNIIYFSLDDTKVNKFDFNVECSSSATGFNHVYGYCNSIPSDSVSYNYLGSLSGSTAYSHVSAIVPKGYKYFFVRLSNSSTFTLNNYSVSYGGLNEVNEQVINQGVETRETLTDSNISQDTADYTLPSDSTNDITQEGFNSIFERIRSTFTSGSSTPLVVTIPFTNKSFIISYDTVFGSANLGLVRSIIESFWWFVISLFITKDIFKKIEKIKTGNIEFTETTNIKEDIL